MTPLNGLNGIGGVKTSNKGKEPQTSFYQAAIYYQTPVKDELGIDDRKARKLKVDDKKFVMPYYSNAIFFSENDVFNYIPYFIKELIDKKMIDSDVFMEDGQLDESKCRAAIVPLNLTRLELIDDN